MPTEHRVYHGCGHFWIIATEVFDDLVRVSEAWTYAPPLVIETDRDVELPLVEVGQSVIIKNIGDAAIHIAPAGQALGRR